MSNKYSSGRTSWPKYYALLLVAFLFSQGAWSQVSAYSFAQSTGTYTPITGGTVLATAAVGGNSFDSQVWTIASGSFPFSFTFNGGSYTGAYVSSNGFITFGTTAPSAFTTTPLSTSMTGTNAKIAAWAGDLNTFGGVAGRTGEVRWEVVGTAPNREVVIQLANWRAYYNTSVTAVYSFDMQYRLGENGQVSIVYGNMGTIIGSPTSSGTRQIGLGGAAITDYNNRLNANTLAFTSSSAGVANSSVQNYNIVTSPPGMPTAGLTYTWSPPLACQAVSLLGGTTSAASTNVCPGFNFTLNVTGGTTGATGITYQWWQDLDGAGGAPATQISGATSASLTTSTTVANTYFREEICAANTTSAFSTPISITVVAPENAPTAVEPFNTFAPGCWREATGNLTASSTLTFVDGEWLGSNFANVSGDTGFKVNLYAAGNSWVISPSIDLGTGAKQLQYNYAVTLYNATGAVSDLASHRVDVVISTDNGATWSNANIIKTYTGAGTYSNTGAGETISLAAYSGIIKIAFVETTTSTTPDIDFHVDDFQISAIPSCLPVTGVTASAVTTSGANISWTAPSPAPTGYEYVVNTTGVTPVGAGTPNAGTSVTLSGLPSNTTHYVFVRSDCSGDFSPWVSTSFYTGYCLASSPNTTTYISNFVTSGGISNISNASGASVGGFGDFSAQAAEVIEGSTLDFTITATDPSDPTHYSSIWVDWNNDLDFADAGENVFINVSSYINPTSGSIAIPSGQPNGSYRMRVRMEWSASTIPSCGAQSRGEGEDYTLTVIDAPACLPPTALTATAVTASSANLGWTIANVGESLWNIEYGISGFTLGGVGSIPVGGVNSNPYAISGLSANTTYQFYVQADCGSSTSAWAGPFSFTTAPGCGSAFNDPAGASSPYLDETDYTVTICPDVVGEVVSVNFTSFATESGYDGLMIYNGPNTSSPLISSGAAAGFDPTTCPAGAWSGTTSPGTVISTDVSGCLTFRFTSDPAFLGANAFAGWTSTITCDVPPTCGTPGVSGVIPSYNAVSFTINASVIGTPAGYEYEIVLDGATPTGTGVTSATNTITSATTLAPSTAYDLYVRTDCGVTDGFSDWAGPISFTTNPAPPANDDCANAITISCAATPVAGTTTNATVDANYINAGAGGSNTTERGVWYTIVGDDNAYTINTCSAVGYDTRLTVFSGSCGSLVPITGNDDMGSPCSSISTLRSQVTFNAFVGTTYYVFVHGYQANPALSATGNFELNISCAPACVPAANDACASAEVLAQNVSCVNVTGTTLCAGNTVGLANPTGVSGFATFNDVWYQFTATSNDYNLTFSNLVASGLIFSIYVGDDCSTFVPTGINGFDVVSGVPQGLFGATIGETYWLRVGVDPAATTPVDGAFDLCLVALPCSTPTSATVTATSNTNVSVVINGGIEGEAYIIEYGPTGYTPGTAGTAGAGGTIVNTTTLTNNVAVAANSNYTFYVRKDCSATAEGYSFNVGPYNVSTFIIVPTTGTNTITTCDATIYDSGTTGNFLNNSNGTLTVYPGTPGSVLALNGTWQGGENCCDFLRFYQGVGTSGTLLATYTNAALLTIAVQATAPDQPITIQFTSDFSGVGPGFAVTASCLEACSGIPAVGVLNGPATACSGVSFTMNVASPSLGYVYQWQRVTSAGWVNIPGANSSSYTTSQTTATTYRCRVTCSYPGGYLGISAPKTVGMSNPADCYCTPTPGSNTAGDYIQSVELAGISNTSGVNPTSYTLYPATPGLTTSLGAGGEYVADLTVGSWTSANNIAAWIDFNRNGIFEASEKLGQTDGLGSFGVASFSFTVPANASLGASRLRVREVYSNTVFDACSTTGNGEVEDYVVTLVAGVANDAQANATAVAPPQFPGCSSFNVNLANATPSEGTGNDVWYRFTAVSNAVRIAVTGSQNVEIEVEDALGASVPTASATSTANASNTGSEIYITGGLTPGQQYWVAVRDMSGTPGTASVCIQTLNDSRCDNGPNFASLCQAFKADWTGTNSYNFSFTNTATSTVYTASSTNSTQILLSSVAGLQYGQSYNVSVSSVFNLVDAAGAPVQVIANSNESCLITIAPQPAVNLRLADRDPVTRAIGAFISTDISVCAVQSWDWSFELVDNLGAPADLIGAQIVNTGSSSRYFRTSNIPGVFGGARYRVRIRPVFASGPGTFDDASFFYLRIAGVAPGMVVADEETTPSELYMERNTENGVFAAIYPNPSNGELVNLNLAGIDSENVNIRIMDATGRVVWTNRYVVEGALNTVIAFDRPLTSGLYMVEMTFGNEVITERMMVTK